MLSSLLVSALVLIAADREVATKDTDPPRGTRPPIPALAREGEPVQRNILPPGKVEQQLLAGQIFIVGNECTRSEVILRQLNFGPGDKIDRDDLFVAQLRLKRLNLFKGQPEIKILDEEGANPDKDILVTIKEKKTSVGFGVTCLIWLTYAVEGSGFEEVLYKIEETRGVNPFSFGLLLVFETALDVVGSLEFVQFFLPAW